MHQYLAGGRAVSSNDTVFANCSKIKLQLKLFALNIICWLASLSNKVNFPFYRHQ